jgi:hypothetical protein
MASPRARPRPKQLRWGHLRNRRSLTLEGTTLCRGGGGSRVFKAQASPTQTSTSNGAGERTEVKAACTGSQSKDAIPEMIVVQPRPIHTDPATPTVQSPSPLEGIADLLDNLLTNACVELTRHLLTMASTPSRRITPKGSPQKRYPLPSRVWQRSLGGHVRKAVGLVCWNAFSQSESNSVFSSQASIQPKDNC